MAGFRVRRREAGGFAVVLADYFFEHGCLDWLELEISQIKKSRKRSFKVALPPAQGLACLVPPGWE